MRKVVALSELNSGAIEELFFRAMAEVLDNIQDPNTEATAVRKIGITVTIKPNDKRTAAGLATAVSVKIPGVKPVATVVYLGKHQGENSVVEAAPNGELFAEPQGKPTAVVGGEVGA